MNSKPIYSRAAGAAARPKCPRAAVTVTFIIALQCQVLTLWANSDSRILAIESDAGRVSLTWNSVPGLEYQVHTRDALGDGGWVTSGSVIATANMTTWSDDVGAQSRYYQLLLPAIAPSPYGPPEPPPGRPCKCDGPERPAPGPSDVYLYSGEFHSSEVDLRIPGRGLDFVWSRKYRSRVGPNTAMGNGWDFSYNIYIEQSGPNILIRDGNARSYTAYVQPDGSFVADEYFTEGRMEPDGSFELVFPDMGLWRFAPLDGSPWQGRISEIRDRNGNSLHFEYDPFGQLSFIRDTLDRIINILYTPEGFIDRIIDFAGREVRYEHYMGFDGEGSFGDLKSVTSPRVMGTSTGNDFPEGKTTHYTYTVGLPEPRLNHNLLTITDAKGQTWLRNEYSFALDPVDRDFDRIVGQTVGDAGDVKTFSYAEEQPQQGNGFAVIKAVVNDAMGNVSEYRFDRMNRCVSERLFTGRSVVGIPVTDTDNRPVNPLRPDDPPFFETRYEWNIDSLVTRVIRANGNSTENIYELDLNWNAARRSRANLRERHELPGVLGGDQDEIVELFEYDEDRGGCCGSNFVIRHTDGRGNDTRHAYDERGNRTNSIHRISSIREDYEYNDFGQLTLRVQPDNGSNHRRRDVFNYYTEGPMQGYLREEIIDEGGFELTTTYEYDIVGNLIRKVDPRGNDTLYEVNALNQVVRETSREVADGSGIRYVTDTHYDPNDNVERIDVENRDETGLLDANTHLTTQYEYDILNYVTRTIQEVTEEEDVVTENRYDRNRNRRMTLFGEATAGRQPNNAVQTLYDERNLLYRLIRAPGSPDQSTSQYSYDSNGNLLRGDYGLEDDPRRVRYVYDGFDRRTVTIDPMGNVVSYRYDANGNRVHRHVSGELLDLPGDAGNVRLEEVTYVYDAMDRRVVTDVSFFITDTQLPVEDGHAWSVMEYSDISQIVEATDENGAVTRISYDTANRQGEITDAGGNRLIYGYDPNGNVVRMTEVDRSDLDGTEETYVTRYVYDNLDRRTSVMDNVSNQRHLGYDSRGNLVVEVDAEGAEVRYGYDGLNRLLMTVRDMNGNGADELEEEDIVTRRVWDASSRVTALIDDNAQATTYLFDPLNRVMLEQAADQTFKSHSYDVHGNRVQTTDANGSVVTRQHDHLNRLSRVDVVRGAGVVGPMVEEFRYDGIGRTVRAQNDTSLVTRSYDSLSHLVLEVADGREIRSVYDKVGNQLRCTYPGGRVIDTTYDAIYREKEISEDGELIAQYGYLGISRVAELVFGNGTRTDYVYDGLVANAPDDFGVRRIVRTTHSHEASGVVIDDRTYAWNRVGAKTRRVDVRQTGPELTHEYVYDPIYRLTRTTVSTSLGAVDRQTDYTLDGVGNRLLVSGLPNAGNYVMDGTAPDPADAQVNQYTATPMDQRQYDLNGNLTEVVPNAGGDSRRVRYDYRNQMVEWVDLESGQRHTYTYDAFGRRTSRVVDTDGLVGGPVETRYFYDQWRVVEEQGGAEETRATYVYGRYIDEVLQMQRGTEVYYYHADDIYNVMAVTDGDGFVVERYVYGDYGKPEHRVRVQSPDGVMGFISDVEFGELIFDDVAFDEATVISGLRWWGAYGFGDVPQADNFTIRFYSDEGGFPGVLVYEEHVGNEVERRSTGRILNVGPAEYVYDAELANPFVAEAGTKYWLSVVNDTTGEAASWGFGTAMNGNGRLLGRSATGGEWDSAATDAAFELFADRSAVGNPYLFTGRRYDEETGLYYYRTRYLEPDAGRFTTRDVIGIWGDAANLGNGYTYVNNDPWSTLDPSGMDPERGRTYKFMFRDRGSGYSRRVYELGQDLGLPFGIAFDLHWDCEQGKISIGGVMGVGISYTEIGGGIKGFGASHKRIVKLVTSTFMMENQDCRCEDSGKAGKRVCIRLTINVYITGETQLGLGKGASTPFESDDLLHMRFCCRCECPKSDGGGTPPPDSGPSGQSGTKRSGGGSGSGGTGPSGPTSPTSPTSPTGPTGGNGGTAGRPGGTSAEPGHGHGKTQITYGRRAPDDSRRECGGCGARLVGGKVQYGPVGRQGQ